MTDTQSLPTAVDTLENKAREHKQAQNTQYHVSVARHNIDRINDEFEELIEALQELKYYRTVLKEAFGESPPTALGSPVETAENAAGITQEELLENVQSGEIGSGDVSLGGGQTDPAVKLTSEVETHIKQIQSAKQQVKNATEAVQTSLRSERDEWTTKVSAAEELQKILSNQNSDFTTTLNHMQQLLKKKLMDPSGTASKFVAEWSNAIENWEEHQSLQSLDDFKERHDLSESTIEDIRTLSQSRKLTLADVSIESLTEMKRVDGLESAVELRL